MAFGELARAAEALGRLHGVRQRDATRAGPLGRVLEAVVAAATAAALLLVGRLPLVGRLRLHEHVEEDAAQQQGHQVEAPEQQHQLLIGCHVRQSSLAEALREGLGEPGASPGRLRYSGRPSWPATTPRSSTSPSARSTAPARCAACAAPVAFPGSSTAARATPSRSTSTPASCATRWPTRTRSSSSRSTAAARSRW